MRFCIEHKFLTVLNVLIHFFEKILHNMYLDFIGANHGEQDCSAVCQAGWTHFCKEKY